MENVNLKSKFFGCIWKMCAFTMFHPRWILASNLSIVPFSLELSGIRLICASSLRFTEGFCMESIKYEQRQILIFWIFIYQNVNIVESEKTPHRIYLIKLRHFVGFPVLIPQSALNFGKIKRLNIVNT